MRSLQPAVCHVEDRTSYIGNEEIAAAREGMESIKEAESI